MKIKHFGIASAVVCLAACGQMTADPGSARTPTERPNEIMGVASVIDGDTIEIHGRHIRLSGFDSPERDKQCANVNVYQQAANYLSDRLAARIVTCRVTGKSYDRDVAVCSVGGADLGDLMVGAGWARDWPKYSHGAYKDVEARARAAHEGIWNLDCPDDLWGDRRYD